MVKILKNKLTLFFYFLFVYVIWQRQKRVFFENLMSCPELDKIVVGKYLWLTRTVKDWKRSHGINLKESKK